MSVNDNENEPLPAVKLKNGEIGCYDPSNPVNGWLQTDTAYDLESMR